MSFRSALLLLLMPTALFAAPYTAFQDGESFVYRVGWGIFTKAGEIRVKAKKEVFEGRTVFRITMVTASKGIVKGLYRYEDTAEGLIDAETGRLIVATEVAYNDEKTSDARTTFDYTTRKATHKDPLRPGRETEFSLPAGDPVDLISALVQTRDWATEPGLKRDALIFAGRDVYPVSIYAEAFETIDTRDGEVRALALSPRMETEAPRGIFKKGGQIRVWVSQDKERLPIRMQLKLKFGTASLTLVEHKLPVPAAEQQAKVEPPKATASANPES